MNNPNEPTFEDCYIKGFPIGALLSAATLASGIIYCMIKCPSGQGDNTFYALLGAAMVNVLLTPIIIAIVLFLKSRITKKFTFKQTYKF